MEQSKRYATRCYAGLEALPAATNPSACRLEIRIPEIANAARFIQEEERMRRCMDISAFQNDYRLCPANGSICYSANWNYRKQMTGDWTAFILCRGRGACGQPRPAFKQHRITASSAKASATAVLRYANEDLLEQLELARQLPEAAATFKGRGRTWAVAGE
eukprot:6208914-Pleurochrysis_carterae.AAC.1